MKIAGFCAQATEGVRLTGKILLGKDLHGIFWGWTGVLAGRWVKNRERTWPITGRTTWLSAERRAAAESFDSLRSLRISAAGSDARKAPQDAGSVRLPTPGTNKSPSSFRERV